MPVNLDEAIQSSFLKVFPQSKFSLTLRRSDVKDWDSICHVKFLYEVEKKLSIRFTGEEAAKISSIKDIQIIISKKYDAQAAK